MGSFLDLMVRLADESDPDIGVVDHIDDGRWIICGQDIFPIQIELLQGGRVSCSMAQPYERPLSLCFCR